MNESAYPMDLKCTDDDYNDALLKLDVVTCEAMAVSQAIREESSDLHMEFSAQVFKRLCAHSMAIICALPRSRWVASDFENWDFACIAGHSRALLEGCLLFRYLAKTPSCNAEWSARLYVLYINDHSRRAEMMTRVRAEEEAADWIRQADELRERLGPNPWFQALDGKTKKRSLAGDNVTISTRDEIIEYAYAGLDKASFYAVWNLLSQYSHVLPMSFTTTENNGRGSGLPNQADLDYMTTTASLAADTLHNATNLMTDAFPDAQSVRNGIESKFTPGPKANAPDGT
ncbi:hypothetical protein [Pseudomonas aeruginosa]|uniref:hypothetical protein n=1 Tax=Pseudomonas aeruginosa TaxID=287 RepID=UPI000FFB489F|nr:hypothetical protein [Pseudomonas aeruginosa]